MLLSYREYQKHETRKTTWGFIRQWWINIRSFNKRKNVWKIGVMLFEFLSKALFIPIWSKEIDKFDVICDSPCSKIMINIFLRNLLNRGDGGVELSESWFWTRESILSSEPLGEYEPKPCWKDLRKNCGVREATCCRVVLILECSGTFWSPWPEPDIRWKDRLLNLGESIKGSGGRRRDPRLGLNPGDPSSTDIDFRFMKGVPAEPLTLSILFIPELLISSSFLDSGYTSLHIESSSILFEGLKIFPSKDLLFQCFFGTLSNDLCGRNSFRRCGFIRELFSRDILRIVSVSVTSWTDFWRGKYWNDFRLVCGVQYCSWNRKIWLFAFHKWLAD